MELDEDWVEQAAAGLAPLASALGEDAADWVRTGGEDYGLLVVFNSSPEAITEQIDGMAGIDLGLSPIQANGADPVVRETTWDARTGTVGIPAHTVAVLLQHRR